MLEINNLFGSRLKVIQSLDDLDGSYPHIVFIMETENVPPGFTLLRCVKWGIIPDPKVINVSQNINGIPYLSSNLYIDDLHSILKKAQNAKICNMDKRKLNRQGPSIEQSVEVEQPYSKPGRDTVPCIRCTFWPRSAGEWKERPRFFGWPTASDIASVVEFGCHLVPVGHAKSDLQMMEWRLSFSIAERILVWSFSHVQLQLYAVMKIVLKEFIKVKCRPKNYVLCSYFIKTFLFWEFEERDLNSWQTHNFMSCLRHLIIKFLQCIRNGELRHYFCPRFNLLSVKLTREAQTELLQLLEIAIQYDIAIFKKCVSLSGVWSNFDSCHCYLNDVKRKAKRHYILNYDDCIMKMIEEINQVFYEVPDLSDFIQRVSPLLLDLLCKTRLLSLTLSCLQFQKHFTQYPFRCSRNRDIYKLFREIKYDTLSFDITTYKLRYAIVTLVNGDYTSTLATVNQVLSSIPPYALYHADLILLSSNDTKNMYKDMFVNSKTTVINRAKAAWLFDLVFVKHCADDMPLAIQIELHFSDGLLCLHISPFTIAYYLMFLCYHGQRDVDRRNGALRQLMETVYNKEQQGIYRYHSYNIAGHCLLVTGDITRARDMFTMSYQLSEGIQPLSKYNSALWYLQHII